MANCKICDKRIPAGFMKHTIAPGVCVDCYNSVPEHIKSSQDIRWLEMREKKYGKNGKV